MGLHLQRNKRQKARRMLGSPVHTFLGVPIATGTATWTETAIGSMTADIDCDMATNDVIISKIHMVASVGEFARVGEIRIHY